MWCPLALLLSTIAPVGAAALQEGGEPPPPEPAEEPLPLFEVGEGEEPPVVREVTVVGNRSIANGRVLGGLATQATDRFLFFGEVRTLLVGEVVEDVRRIEALYRDEGFWAPEVSYRILPLPDGEVEVRFFVVEGPPAVVETLLVTGMDSLPEELVRHVLSRNPIEEGKRWTESDHQAFKRQIYDRLVGRGYAAAAVRARVEVQPEEGIASVIVQVSPGDRYRFGDILVVGNQMISTRRIMGAVDPIFEEGDWYDPVRLQRAQEEITALGVFATAVASTGPPDPSTRRVPVTITVREADFLRLRLGGGAGIDQSYQQVRLIADFAHLDVFGGLQRLELNNELAYRFIFGSAEVESGFAGIASAQLTQPDVIGNNVDLAARVAYERQLTLSFISQSVRGSLGVPIRFRRWLYLVPSYHIQHYFGVRSFASPVVTGEPLPPVNCPDGCTFSFLEQRLVVDRRSDPLEPRSGFYAALGLQEGGGLLGGSFDWLRFTPEVRGYVSFGPSWVLAMRLELGYLQPLGNLDRCREQDPNPYDLSVRCSPIVVRFFGGGAGGFRGAGAGRLSPLQAVPVGEGDDRRTVFVPLGGNSSILGTTELRWYFSRSWAAVLFADAANVAAGSTAAFDIGDLLYAVGSGVRVRTPVGPIRLDVGYRILRRHIPVVNSDEVLEDNLIDWFSLYLSIGEAF